MPKKSRNSDEQVSFRFLPLTVSLQTKGGIATPLVLRGSPLPAIRTHTFSTADDDQKAVTLRLSMGERPLFDDNTMIVGADLSGIPPQPKGKPQIEVRVEIDRECRVSLVAVEKTSGKKLEIDKKSPALVLTQDEVQRHLDSAESSRESDQKALKEAELKLKLEELIQRAENRIKVQSSPSVSTKLAALGLAIETDVQKDIRQAMLSLEESLDSDQFGNIFGDIFGNSHAGVNSGKTKQVPIPRRPVAGTPASYDAPADIADTTQTAKLGAIFGGGDFTLDPALCFVLMPFDRSLQGVFDEHIKVVIEGESLACVRADDIVGTRQITIDIWESINRARFLLADLTGQNANVFYELGLAHALGKEVILVTQSMDHVPFDLKGVRCLVYEYTPSGMRSFEHKLRRTIRELMTGS